MCFLTQPHDFCVKKKGGGERLVPGWNVIWSLWYFLSKISENLRIFCITPVFFLHIPLKPRISETKKDNFPNREKKTFFQVENGGSEMVIMVIWLIVRTNLETLWQCAYHWMFLSKEIKSYNNNNFDSVSSTSFLFK